MTKLTTVDLFSGAGGMTEGFRQAGYECKLAIEIDPMAVTTFRFNHPNTPVINKDIRNIQNEEIQEFCGKSNIDVVTGGPPCQMFSLAGPRIADDPRNFLFKEFVRVVKLIQPKYFVFENVLGLLSMKGGEVLNAIKREFVAIGYRCDSKVVSAADFGVPQARPRVLIIGTRLSGDLPFPERTHAPLTSQGSLFGSNSLRPYVTVGEALSNLPVIVDGDGAEELSHPMLFDNQYQKDRVGERTPGVIYNHRSTRHAEIIKQRYASIPEGGSSRDIPPHLQTKKANIYKLQNNSVSRTVTCNHRTDLLHPVIPRGTTVREVARLQSFDDDYRFFGNLTRKAKWVTQDDQVGNAVPPLLARSIALAIAETLNIAVSQVIHAAE